MRKQTKLALLAVAAAAVTSTAQAAYNNGDLLVGFTSQGAANDYIFDIGTYGGIYGGETWSLAGLTGSGGNFTSSQFAAANWGLIGALNTGVTATKTIYSTLGSSTAGPNEVRNRYNTIAANVLAVGTHSIAGSAVMIAQADSSGNSWNQQTLNSAPGANTFQNNLDSPDVGTGAAAYLWANANLGAPATLLGDFTVSADGSALTFTEVPEPASYGALAGLGLLVIALRRQFTCKA